jgi:hypothetical protein
MIIYNTPFSLKMVETIATKLVALVENIISNENL